jgi:hypothetical protein
LVHASIVNKKQQEDSMKRGKRNLLVLVSLLLSMVLAFGVLTTSVAAAEVEEIHFLIPGGAGGGLGRHCQGCG